MTYPGQRSLVRQCIVDALLDANAPYAKDCDPRAIIDAKCLGDSPTGFLDHERSVCCQTYIAVYTGYEEGEFYNSGSCGDAAMQVVVEIYTCHCSDLERECAADETTDAVMHRLAHLRGNGIKRVMKYEIRTQRDRDRLGTAYSMRQIILTVETLFDFSPPLCDQTPACAGFEYVEAPDQK